MIFDSLRWMRHLIFLEGDDGGGSGGAGSGDDSAAGEDGAESKETTAETTDTGGADDSKEKDESVELQAPGYFAQLPNDKAKSEAYKALYKYQKLDDLTDALIKAEGDLAAFQGKRALIVPEKGDKEGIEKFKETLGVPKDPKEYRLQALNDFAGDEGRVIAAIQKGCQRIMLTPHQAEAVAEMMASASKALGIRAAINAREAVRHQTERVASLYKDVYEADIDRTKAAEEDVARYDSFLKETGLEEIINKSPMAGNPQIIKAIAAYAKKHGGTVTSKGGSLSAGGKPTGKTVQNESEDWKNFKAQRPR